MLPHAPAVPEDREGTRTLAEIRRWVGAARAKMAGPSSPAVACLACTHYGYRNDLFAGALREAGVDAAVVNPNERAVDEFFPALASSARRVTSKSNSSPATRSWMRRSKR